MKIEELLFSETLAYAYIKLHSVTLKKPAISEAHVNSRDI
jgi:hypothetical protein